MCLKKKNKHIIILFTFIFPMCFASALLLSCIALLRCLNLGKILCVFWCPFEHPHRTMNEKMYPFSPHREKAQGFRKLSGSRFEMSAFPTIVYSNSLCFSQSSDSSQRLITMRHEDTHLHGSRSEAIFFCSPFKNKISN